MKDYRFHTPDGVSDILPAECAAKKEMEKTLRKLFCLHGYPEIETPELEYLDVYSEGGFVAPENMYKLTDEKGRLLALRYDGTVPTARMAATLIKDTLLPVRLSYIGNMCRFKAAGGGRQKVFTQGGVELLGAGLPEADAEVIALSIAAAREIGIEDMHVSLGQVDFFLGLMEEWGVSEEGSREISGYIDQKNTVALEEAATRFLLSDEEKETLFMLPSLLGTYDILDVFSSRAKGQRAKNALDNLRAILSILEDYGYLGYVSVDMGMLPSLDYYTGMIFKGFTYEVGFPIFSGGRYDRVVNTFGRDIPAVGFSLEVNLCLTALARQRKSLFVPAADCIVGYETKRRKEAAEFLREQRKKGIKAIFDCQRQTKENLLKYAKEKRVREVIFFSSDAEAPEQICAFQA